MELKNLKRIGPKTLEKLNVHQIYTPEELLLCFPKKYTIYELTDNDSIWSGEAVCFRAKIASKPFFIKYRRNVSTIVFYILLQNRKYKCIIFSKEYLRYQILLGREMIFYGRYKKENHEFTLQHVFTDSFECKIDVDYQMADIPDHILSQAIASALDASISVEETLPSEWVEKYRLLPMADLLVKAHFPQSRNDCIQVKRRLRYEQFFWYACSLNFLKYVRFQEQKTPKKWPLESITEKMNSLPYPLTKDQHQAIREIFDDLSSTKVMNRLIQGDVGCGKSIVSFFAAYATMLSGKQVALMVPTEVLALQHLKTFEHLLEATGYHVACLTSGTKSKEREEILYKLLHHRIDLLIGTHALIEERVVFADLGLVVIDEQHRFGVVQRKKLLEKFRNVDALYLTATPIPRTLGLTEFGDLDLTSIHTMPQNRKKIITKLISYEELSSLKEEFADHLRRREQIYVVVPLVTESETLDFMDIDQAYDLFQSMFPQYRFAKLHGKMKSADKQKIMQDFKTHQIDGLVSTTVIEVGVDVPNATIMLILDAERYGLSQIHQLRGRVGRAELQSYCYLVSRKDSVSRLQILCQTDDGFLLAEEDLKLRGPGDFLGEDQSGFQALDFLEDSTDAIIWKCAFKDSGESVRDFLEKRLENAKMREIFQGSAWKKAKIN